MNFVFSNIFILGLVSLFTDISTEMVYPILPLYLTSVIGVTPAIIGIIEGIAESLASIIKLFSGIIADRYGHKKRLAFAGYASSILNKVIILFAATWPGVLSARIVDRFGKGIRTAPRDALIAESAQNMQLGKAYGLHKGLDLLGTAIGIFLAYLMLLNNKNNYRNIFIYSLAPAVVGVLFILLVKDKKSEKINKKISFNWKILDKKLKQFLVCIFIFTLGNSSNAFILLRAYSAGFSAVNTILLYFVFNITGSILSYPVGKLSDKFGRRKILGTGYFLYGIAYLGFGLSSNKVVFVLLFIIYGVYTALTSGTERALIAEIAPAAQKASALGLHAGIVGLGLLPASITAGILWDNLGQSVPFVFGGILAFFMSICILVILYKHEQRKKRT